MPGPSTWMGCPGPPATNCRWSVSFTVQPNGRPNQSGKAVAVGDSGDPDLREVAYAVFTAWTETLTERLKAAGLGPKDARDLATTLLAILEGAHVLARAAVSTAPFDQTARTVLELADSWGGQHGRQR